MCQSAVFSPLVSGESFTLPRSAERNSLAQVQRKNCRPDRVNRLRGSSVPVNRCREKTDVSQLDDRF